MGRSINKYKVALLGAYSVGKTSLVQRFVHSLFSERYLSTVGVKIDRRDVSVHGRDLCLVLWDIHGENEVQAIRTSYLRGTAGYLLVVDGTRGETVATAVDIHERIRRELGPRPFVVLTNKADLEPDWELTEGQRADLESLGGPVLRTSARTGDGVEEAFTRLARDLIAGSE